MERVEEFLQKSDTGSRMIQYLKHNEVDRKKWDKAIDQSVNSLIYGYSWYLDIVSPNWNALAEGDYESVMPLTRNKKYGVDYLYPPYFAQQLGVFSKKEISKEKVQAFLNAIPSNYKFMEIYLNTRNTFDLSGVNTKKNINIELAMDSSYESLRKKYGRNTQRNIQKAAKHSVELRKKISPSELISIFRKNKGEQVNNLKDKHYKTLLHLINTCIQKGYAECWGAMLEGKLCAGVICLVKNKRAIFLFSASNEAGKRSHAMFFLIDKFIQEFAGKNMIFDFEGSNLPGVARLYKSFGSEEYVYLLVRKNNLPKLVRWVKEIK